MTLRCAIYTRVSTEHGLEQEFNSLDNQREAAEAYVKSQAHEGWRLLRDRYDDGGFSGGSMERPALLRLLEQVKQKRVNVIVVYKVDRLTRSLADFAKLVELFDANGVSFVSVTQAFNTTTSMGRLTLNVLLSFAQFEREVTGERIRDKIAASKRRGLWVGGMVPLGYRVENKKLAIVEEEAEQVRLIFRRYLELGSIGKLLVDLRERKLVTKAIVRDGVITRGAIPFAQGSLAYLLHNRFYIGEISFKGAIHKAEHPAILDRTLFDAVQERLAAQRVSRVKRGHSGALLIGKLFDAAGHRMTPTHATKKGRRYRYYATAAEPGAPIKRVAAPEIERLVTEAIQLEDTINCEPTIERVELGVDKIIVWPTRAEPIIIPWQPPSTIRHREIIAVSNRAASRPMRADTRETLLTAIAKGRSWIAEIMDGATPDMIAIREGSSPRQVSRILSLAHLAPNIVEAAIRGTLPNGIGFRELVDSPADWSKQREQIGLSHLAS